MIPHQVLLGQPSGEDVIHAALREQMLLEIPLLNEGSAFDEEERCELGLLGPLPPHVPSPEEPLERAHHDFRQEASDIETYVFLASLQDRNETLCYRLPSTRCCRSSTRRRWGGRARSARPSTAGPVGSISRTRTATGSRSGCATRPTPGCG